MDIEIPGAREAQGKLNTLIAITVAILATFMGICKVKDDNLVQAMMQTESQVVDTWAEFQAKSIKQHLAQMILDQSLITPQALPLTPAGRHLYEQQVQFFRGEVERYNQEKAQLQKRAMDLEKQYNELNFHDDQFDLSDAILSITLALMAITALTQKRWLYWLALIPAFLGILMGLAGLFSWRIHPTPLIRWLS